MRQRLAVFLSLTLCACCLAGLPGCAATTAVDGTDVDSVAAVLPADIDRLTGPRWNGTLTYLDYTSRKESTITSSLQVTRLPKRPDGSAAWEMRVGYADEPHADGSETAVLTRGGREFRDERVLERTMLPDGTVRVITAQEGQDDNRPAEFRFVYLLGQNECSIQKLVRVAPEDGFFERNIYRWSR